MDTRKLIELLGATINPKIRQEAEEQLRQVSIKFILYETCAQ